MADVQRVGGNSTGEKQRSFYKRPPSRINTEVLRDSGGLETFKKTFNPNLGPEKK